jgi:hypothetical protein
MWWEKAGEEVVKEIVATSSGVREGIDRLLEYLHQRRPHAIWRRMAKLDYEGDVQAIQDWFIAQFPIPHPVAVLWFAFWDVTEGFDLRGSTRWSQNPEDWEWWYHADYNGKSYESSVLVQMHALACEVESPEVVRPKGGVWDLMEYLLTIGYVSLERHRYFAMPILVNFSVAVMIGGL